MELKPHQTGSEGLLGRLPACPPLVKALFAADVLMGLFAVVGFVFGSAGGLWDLVRLGEESNVPTWYSSSQLLLIGVVLAPLVARHVRLRSLRTWPLVLIPAFFVLLSLDEGAMLHERIGDWFQEKTNIGSGLRTGPWIFVYVPIIGVLFLMVVRLGWPFIRGRRGALWLLGGGVVTMGAAAVGLEFVANFVADGSLAQKGLGFVEEVGEMVAATLLLWGALEVVRLEGIALSMGTAPDAEARVHQPAEASAAGRAHPGRSRRRAPYSASVQMPPVASGSQGLASGDGAEGDDPAAGPYPVDPELGRPAPASP